MCDAQPTVTTLVITSTLRIDAIVKQILDLLANTYSNNITIYRVVMLGEVINKSVEYYSTALQAALEGGY